MGNGLAQHLEEHRAEDQVVHVSTLLVLRDQPLSNVCLQFPLGGALGEIDELVDLANGVVDATTSFVDKHLSQHFEPIAGLTAGHGFTTWMDTILHDRTNKGPQVKREHGTVMWLQGINGEVLDGCTGKADG